MMEAVMRCLERLTDRTDIDYVYLCSGADSLTKPLAALKAHLTKNKGKNFIQCMDQDTRWIVDGIQKERYELYHVVNWRDHPKLFSFLVKVQKMLRIRRILPDNMRGYFGSQWWCLTFAMAMNILRKARRPDISRFYKYTWVPDEMMFQTLAASLEDPANFLPSLTYCKFNSNGKPVYFFDDHYNFIKSLPHFFVRKVADEAAAFRYMYRDDSASKPYFTFVDSLPYYTQPLLYARDQYQYFGPLLLNKVKYAIVFTYNTIIQNILYSKLKQLSEANVYYHLFNAKAIVYGKKKNIFPYYSVSSVALRDKNKLNFIRDLLDYFNDKLNVIFLNSDMSEADKLFYDKNSIVLFALPSALSEKIYVDLDTGEIDGAKMPLDEYSSRLKGQWPPIRRYLTEAVKNGLDWKIITEHTEQDALAGYLFDKLNADNQ
jgi:hypothetical protein